MTTQIVALAFATLGYAQYARAAEPKLHKDDQHAKEYCDTGVNSHHWVSDYNFDDDRMAACFRTYNAYSSLHLDAEAARYQETSCEMDHASSCRRAAERYKKIGDEGKAAFFWMKACDLGHGLSCSEAAAYYFNHGDKGKAVEILTSNSNGCSVTAKDPSYCWTEAPTLFGDNSPIGIDALRKSCGIGNELYSCHVLDGLQESRGDVSAAANAYANAQAQREAEKEERRQAEAEAAAARASQPSTAQLIGAVLDGISGLSGGAIAPTPRLHPVEVPRVTTTVHNTTAATSRETPVATPRERERADAPVTRAGTSHSTSTANIAEDVGASPVGAIGANCSAAWACVPGASGATATQTMQSPLDIQRAAADLQRQAEAQEHIEAAQRDIAAAMLLQRTQSAFASSIASSGSTPGAREPLPSVPYFSGPTADQIAACRRLEQIAAQTGGQIDLASDNPCSRIINNQLDRDAGYATIGGQQSAAVKQLDQLLDGSNIPVGIGFDPPAPAGSVMNNLLDAASPPPPAQDNVSTAGPQTPTTGTPETPSPQLPAAEAIPQSNQPGDITLAGSPSQGSDPDVRPTPSLSQDAMSKLSAFVFDKVGESAAGTFFPDPVTDTASTVISNVAGVPSVVSNAVAGKLLDILDNQVQQSVTDPLAIQSTPFGQQLLDLKQAVNPGNLRKGPYVYASDVIDKLNKLLDDAFLNGNPQQ